MSNQILHFPEVKHVNLFNFLINIDLNHCNAKKKFALTFTMRKLSKINPIAIPTPFAK